MKFRDLLESPFNGGNMDEIPRAKAFSKQTQIYISDVGASKKLFGKYMYGTKKDVFVVFENNNPVFYILYNSIKKSMRIKSVENISNIKDLSFKVYSAILNLKLYNSIYTGDVLSTKNIKAHKKYIQNGFKLYISDRDEPIGEYEFDSIISKSNIHTEFILRNSDINELLVRVYDGTLIGKDKFLTIDPLVEGEEQNYTIGK